MITYLMEQLLKILLLPWMDLIKKHLFSQDHKEITEIVHPRIWKEIRIIWKVFDNLVIINIDKSTSDIWWKS